ncbi:nose resistant to fluoxetine protein 6-like [Thrips palmi]|uniref:Nose resistant to fluoxetine protein 6-like n=1 Tax=Thrips palmi TaxID=161013 RepID=A0A6P8XY51_THRPL|nr:nose resistant to fluoxetine protein 6-like [Thrips palmi]
MRTAHVVLPLLLLLGQSSGQSSAAHDDALQQLAESIVFPDSLRQHVQQVGTQVEGVTDCLAGLGRWAAGLATLQPWALQMVDSSAKLVTGVLYLNTWSMGNFDECVAAGDAELGWTGRYLLPTVEVAANGSAKGLAIKMAVCVPGSCQPGVLRAALARAADAVNSRLGWDALRCSLDDKAIAMAGPARKTTAADTIMICACLGLVLLVLVATTLDFSMSPEAKMARKNAFLLLAFSAKENARRLMTRPSAGDFTCINGIRFLSAMWVVLGHRYIALIQVPFMNLLDGSKRAKEMSTMVIINAPLSVDTFFLVGGMVNAYGFLRMTERSKSFDFIMYNVHRYVRLTPAFALMIGITATWLSLLSTGPVWNHVVGVESEYCQKYWWSALLYVANYVNPDTPCMGQAWYLMVDMQLHWLSPLLLIPLWKWGRWGVVWLFFVLCASCAVPFALTYIYRLPTPFPTELNLKVQQSFMRNMYLATHPRATAYVFGTLGGYILFLIKTGRIKPRLTPTLAGFGWVFSTVLCVVVIFSAHPLMDTKHHPYNVWEAASYAGLYRLGWSLGIAWVVFACILDYGGPINVFLSWRLFTVLGRLTYGIYLTHMAVQLVDHGTMRSPLVFSDFSMVEGMFSDALFAIFFGFCLCLAVESPISALEKHFRTTKKGVASLSVSKEPLPVEQDVKDPIPDEDETLARAASSRADAESGPSVSANG